MRYKDEKDIERLVRSFEDATITRDEWKHAEHLVVGMYYLRHHDLEEAIDRMRDGIFNLLTRGFGVDLSKEMPYHETLTVFWMRTIAARIAGREESSMPEVAAELLREFDKDYPLRSYSRELLFSDEARSRYVEPDLVDEPSAAAAANDERDRIQV
ncbi:MAG: hypothetical protein ACK4S4_05645 [Pyrinomonadaceae bacterium]